MRKTFRVTLPAPAGPTPNPRPIAPSLRHEVCASTEESETSTTGTYVVSDVTSAGDIVFELAEDGTLPTPETWLEVITLFGAGTESEVEWTLTWTPDDPVALGDEWPYVAMATRTAIVFGLQAIASFDPVAGTYSSHFYSAGSGTVSATVDGVSAGSISYTVTLATP